MEKYSHTDFELVKLLLGGDQLTVARIHSAKGIRANHEDSKSCLKGLIPVVEDWHTRMTLMQVCVCYSKKSVIMYLALSYSIVYLESSLPQAISAGSRHSATTEGSDKPHFRSKEA